VNCFKFIRREAKFAMACQVPMVKFGFSRGTRRSVPRIDHCWRHSRLLLHRLNFLASDAVWAD